MGTVVQIQVNVNDAKALAALTNIETIGKRLSSTPIEIKINAGAVDKVSKSVIQLTKEQTKQATASAKQAAAEAKVQVAQEKTKQTSNRLAAQQEKTAQSANRLAAGQTKAASATQKAGSEAQKASGLTDLLGDSLGRIIAKQAAWQLLGNGIAGIKNAFVDALDTMKEVDSELATVRKVTGMTKDEMNALGEAAYSTASKYGVSANEYLENVSTFARAGYKDASEELGELAIKTQLVGDTDQETAAQFLLSADAAWKYHGNVEKLSLALDEANTIDNNYATSIQKIAEGLPIVANVAAMAGMSMEETMGMLGTITAVTQETGTKAATAARALILNILGDTTTEIADGVTATEESVKSLSGILQKYAPEVVAAAQATGKLINPMKAIGALSQAAKDGLLTEADLMTLVSALGGKLRTNQLVALLENFDMYSDMLQDMGVAAGSADQEISVMLDTWDAKANILKNTWTEFVSHVADTSLIKGGLDVITGLIKGLDSDFVHFAITVAGVTTAAAACIEIAKSLNGTTFISTLTGMLQSVTDFRAGIALLTETMLASPLFYVALGTAVIYGIVKAVDGLTVSYEEQAQILSDLKSQYQETYGQGTRFDDLKSRVGELTIAEQNEYNILKMRNDEAERQIKIAKDAEFEKWMSENWDKNTAVSSDTFDSKAGQTSTLGADTVSKFRSELAAAHDEYNKGQITLTEYKAKIVEVASGYDALYDKLAGYRDAGEPIGEDAETFLELYEMLAEQAAEVGDTTADAFDDITDATDAATEALQRYEDALDGLKDREEAANKIRSAFEQAKEDFEAGKLGSVNLGAFLEAYVPDDVKSKLKYSIEDMWAWVMNGNTGKILGAGDNMFYEAFNVIKDAFNGGALDGIVEMDGDVIKTISSVQELADALGITEALAQSVIEAISNYMDGMFYTGDQAANVLMQVNEALQGTTPTLYGFLEALRDTQGFTTVEQILESMEALQRAGAIDWLDKLGVETWEEAKDIIIPVIEQLMGKTQELADAANEPISIRVETDDAEAKIRDLEERQAALADNPIEVPTEAPGAEETAEELGNIKETQDGISDKKDIDVSVNDNASPTLASIKSSIDSLHDKTVTITVVTHNVTTGSSHYSGKFASGTKNAPGGSSLVNDGAPVNGSAAELIVDKGQAYIANDGKPAIVDLSPGATVFTAQETKDIFDSDAKTVIPAFAGGTGLVQPPKVTGGSSRVKARRSSSKKEKDPLTEEIDDLLKNLDKQIKLAQNRNDKAQEQALQEEATRLVKEYVGKYLAKGYSETSDEVLDLLNKGYGYSDDLMDELVDALEALTDSTNKANKLAEKQQDVEDAKEALENVKNQRTVRIYNDETGQWEWIAKADDIKKAQETLDKAQESLRDEETDNWLDALKDANIGDLAGIEMSPAIKELIEGATEEEQRRIADILSAITGSVEKTADTNGESIIKSTDSHDTNYYIDGIKLSEADAKGMTLAQLVNYIRDLNLT